jgi:signal transduction histidine kinase
VPDAGHREIESLKAQVEALEHARDRFADFAALAAHELLKPLILAHSCAARLIEGDYGDLGGPVRAELELMMQASSHARVLVDTLLAEAQSGELMMDPVPVDLTRVVRECIAMLAADLEARRMRVELSQLPVVAGNAVLLAAVFRNLLLNAIEHGSGRRREIRVFAESDDARWRLAVDSPGPPIPEADRSTLFEATWPGTGRRPASGTGLGLILVRRIVERHGGEVGVMSPDDHTNRFFFTLPAASADQAPPSRIR